MTDNETLLEKAKGGDSFARDELINANMGLVHSIAKRFLNRGYDFEDLVQIGAIGLIKAIDRFDSSFDVKLSTYAVPVIMGEIKKFLRDDGPVKVSRSLKELSYKAMGIKEQMENTLGRPVTISELAEVLDVDTEKLILALESSLSTKSLYEKTINDEDGGNVIDKIASNTLGEDEIIGHISLNDALLRLDNKEKNVIIMRYYRNLTQSVTAQLMGVSQVQISRIENKAKQKIKEFLK